MQSRWEIDAKPAGNRCKAGGKLMKKGANLCEILKKKEKALTGGRNAA